MCTGAVSVNPKVPTDGVWMLDYRGGKLLGTVIDRTTGKIGGWAEVDLVSEFGDRPEAGRPLHDDDRDRSPRARRPCTSAKCRTGQVRRLHDGRGRHAAASRSAATT